MLVSSGMAVASTQKMTEWDVSYLFVLGRIYVCGVREAEGIEMVCQECCHCATKHSAACVPD